MWPLAVLTRVFYKKLYGRFAGPNRSGRNNDGVLLYKLLQVEPAKVICIYNVKRLPKHLVVFQNCCYHY